MAVDESEERRLLSDIQSQIQRTKRVSVRTTAVEAQRREILKRLIDLVHSPYSSLKTVAANNIKLFIKEFPDLEDDAINAVYDFCEDPDPKIRKDGYRAITLVSREQKKWVKRNADVLVQLLQSDEPEEVEVVEHQLTEHLDMDPRVTLGVLCDQVIPLEEPLEDDDPTIRDRLRSLVLGFMTGRAKRALVERHAQPTEVVFVEGLAKGMSKLRDEDIDVLVKDILLSLPSYGRYSQSGDNLLDVILAEARASYKAESQADNDAAQSLTKTRYYLSLAAYVSIEKHIARPTSLLRFYCTHFVSRVALMKFSEETRSFVIDNFAISLAALQENAPKMANPPSVEEINQLHNTTVDACLVLFSCFAELKASPHKPWHACQLLLQACIRRKESEWNPPGQLAAILQKIQSQSVSQMDGQDEKSGVQEVRDLIRSLLGQQKPASQEKSSPQPAENTPSPVQNKEATKPLTANGKLNGGAVQIKRRRAETNASKHSAPAAPSPNRAQLQPSRKFAADRERNQHGDNTRARTHTGSTPGLTRATPTADSDFPSKRKAGVGGEGSMPSLLSRLGVASPEEEQLTQPPPAIIPAKRSAEFQGSQAKRANTQQTRTIGTDVPQGGLNIRGIVSSQPKPPQLQTNGRQDTAPEGGFSIKGAASRVVAQSSSLLERINQSGSDGDAGGRGKKRRTKT